MSANSYDDKPGCSRFRLYPLPAVTQEALAVSTPAICTFPLRSETASSLKVGACRPVQGTIYCSLAPRRPLSASEGPQTMLRDLPDTRTPRQLQSRLSVIRILRLSSQTYALRSANETLYSTFDARSSVS
jgi:hypothetical protein